MAGLIAQYQQGTFTTPVNATVADASVVLANDNNVRSKHNSHDGDATIHVQSSTLASRPAAAVAQRVWFTTDTLRLFIDTGSVWNELAYLVGPLVSPTITTPTITGNMTLNGDLLIGVSNLITWTGRSKVQSTADGVVAFTNNAGTGFTRLRLGTGTPTGGVSLKYDGFGALEVRAGDDSGYAQLNANFVLASLQIATTAAVSPSLILNQAGTSLGAGGFSISTAGLVSGAGAGAGTLTNAPSAGNPSFWMPIQINGNTRYIPCWT